MSVDATPKHAFSYDGGDILMTDEHTTLTKCGNLLKFSSIVTNSQHFLQRAKPSRITAFAANVKVSEIALAACEENAEICIYSFPEKKFRGKLKHPSGLSTVFEYYMLRFSRCGTRLLSIGSHDANQVCVWDVDKFELLEGCQASVPRRVAFASFNPLSADAFVTGSDESVTFWRVCKGQRGFCFSHVDGALSHDASREQRVLADVTGINEHHPNDQADDPLEKRHQYVCHCWDKTSGVLVANQLGEILTFDATTGAIRGLVTLSRTLVATAMLLTAEHVVVAFSDGTLRWLAADGDWTLAQAVSLPPPATVAAVASSPSFTVLVVGTTQGALYELKACVDAVDDDDKTSAATVVAPSPLGLCHSGAVLALAVLIPGGGTTNDAVVVSGGVSGLLHVWTVVGCRAVVALDLGDLFDKASSPPAITSVAARYLDPIVLVGDASGRLRIVCLSKSPPPTTVDITPLHTIRVCTSPLDIVEIHPSLPLALVASSFDTTIFVVSLEPDKQFRVVAFVHVPAAATMAKWVPTSSLESTYFVATTATAHVYIAPLVNLDDHSATPLTLAPLGANALAAAAHHGTFLLTPGKMLTYIHRGTKTIHLLKLYDAPGSAKDVEYKALHEKAHGKPLTCIARSILASKEGQEIVATGGADGILTLWLVQTKRSSSAVYLKDVEMDIRKQKSLVLHAGAVTNLAFATCDDYLYVYTVGADGAMYCVDVHLEETLILFKSVAEGASPLYVNLTGGKDKAATNVYERKVRLVLTDDPKPFLEKYADDQDHVARAKFDVVKDSIRGPLAEIQLKLKTMLQHNADLPALEALARDEFVINRDQEAALLTQNDTRANEVRRHIGRQIAEMNIVRDRMKQEFWDASEIKGTQLHGLASSALKVYNFPMRKLAAAEKRTQDMVERLREVEFAMAMAEPTDARSDSAHRRRSSVYHHGDIIPANIGWMVNAGLLHPSIGKKLTDVAMPTTTTATTTDKGKGGPPVSPPLAKKASDELESPKEAGPIRLVDLIYHPAMIRTRKQQRTQLYLLRAYERQLLSDYNTEFDELAKLKEAKMDEIEAKNGRIREICAELALVEPVTAFKWHADERADSMLRLEDGEMTKTPYETEEMRKVREAAEAAQRAADEKNRKDDVAGRALEDMMHGTLETKKETIVAASVAREAWMDDVPPEEMTADQKQKLAAFEAEAAKLADDKEKYKKALDLELKKTKLDIVDVCKAFDDKLKALHELYLATRSSVLTQQMYILRLGEVLMDHEHCCHEKTLLVAEIDVLAREIDGLRADAAQFTARLDACRDEWHKAVDDDKLCEKAFPKEIEDAAGAPLEHDVLRALTDLYRKRRNTESSSDAADGDSNKKKGSTRAVSSSMGEHESSDVDATLDPFAHLDTKKKKQEVKRILPLDPDVDRPEAIATDSIVWAVLNECRAKKITAEQAVKAKNDAFVEAKDVMELTGAKLAALEDKVARYSHALAELESTMDVNSENHPILVKIKQGQDEASGGDDLATLFEETESALLISRASVEALNATIQVHGHDQVGVLGKIKNFRKNINLMEWEHAYLAMQKKNMEDHYTDLQLLRVTKNLQELVTTGDATEKQKQEQTLLESKLAYMGKNHHVHQTKQTKATAALKAQLGDRLKENEQFKRQLMDLQTHIHIREDIVASRRASALKSTPGKPDNKLKAITVRRKLVDLAKAQSEEIEFMRQELDKIRQRTFPSFVQPPPNALAPDDIFDD
ncbi:Aste57867_9603 [Aphanomyces stellatus]|uniref:Cilia- and flagella-associated protein 43 n=1 Tax=Aphanomyces stellatus TaxID=120398 RepID=A0A485KND3_9STRA|nr:hypothetical protein As57867_009565 [Aphanomyces stellatus]VFT86482.1 Aste57867_9603 [Aphanomyces stellatus]